MTKHHDQFYFKYNFSGLAEIRYNIDMSNTNVLRDVHIDRALSPLSPLNTLLNQPRDLGKWQILPHTNP